MACRSRSIPHANRLTRVSRKPKDSDLHTESVERWVHDRTFGQGQRKSAERRTLAVESEGDNRVFDLHVWSVGPGIYAAEIAIVSSRPLAPDDYNKLLPGELGLVHVTVETHRCAVVD